MNDVTEANALQSAKAFQPMEVIELGIITDVRLLQYMNVSDSIVVIELGIVREVMLQPQKALFPM